MAEKKLLIVDDSEIDRMLLKSILCDEFDLIEAENGYVALEIILKKTEDIDAILLDVSMPVIDGFGVLSIMQENGINNIPVFLITAEATKVNIERAAQFNISEFIGKPFERDMVLTRIKSKLGVVIKHKLTEDDIKYTNIYINDLKAVYKKYLVNLGEDHTHYARMTDLMKILLSKYSVITAGIEFERAQIEIISNAAYFADIGYMLIPSNSIYRATKRDETMGDSLYQSHTYLGAEIIKLNRSAHCEYFVQVCTDICTHHHERFDGKGYPYKIPGEKLSAYSQMCILVHEFDNLFFRYREHSGKQFDFVISELSQDVGAVNPEIFSLLSSSKFNISMYYNAKT